MLLGIPGSLIILYEGYIHGFLVTSRVYHGVNYFVTIPIPEEAKIKVFYINGFFSHLKNKPFIERSSSSYSFILKRFGGKKSKASSSKCFKIIIHIQKTFLSFFKKDSKEEIATILVAVDGFPIVLYAKVNLSSKPLVIFGNNADVW